MDVFRFVEPQVGMRCWLYGSTLDRRIRPRTKGTIVYLHPQGWHLEVKLSEYVQRTVAELNVDCGREFRTRSGVWVPESDPRARRWLQRMQADHRAGGRKIEAVRDYFDPADLEWVLTRGPL